MKITLFFSNFLPLITLIITDKYLCLGVKKKGSGVLPFIDELSDIIYPTKVYQLMNQCWEHFYHCGPFLLKDILLCE